MEGILYGFWDSMTGSWTTDKEYIDELKKRIEVTRSKIKR